MSKHEVILSAILAPMVIYFIRHGETLFNREQRAQNREVPLSDLGKEQAKAVAKKITEFPIQSIISSPYLRTSETAAEISKTVNKAVISHELFRELKRPTEVEGTSINDPKGKAIRALIKEHRADPNWHYSDEENFYDIKKRAQEAVRYIEMQTNDHIVIVTHGVFLRMMIGTMMFGDKLDHILFEDIDRFVKTKNTGITICRTNADNQWEMITWNEYCHLR